MSDQLESFNIPKNAKSVVIFIHGFGVRWDSRGMFTDIQQSFPENYGSVFFDFYTITGNDVYVTPIDRQIKRLLQIIATVQQIAPLAKINLIAHSKGCIITALAKPKVQGCVIFLAPPESFGTKLEKYFSRYPGVEKTKTELDIPRKDGTITHIPLNFFAQTQAVNAENAMVEYAKNQTIHLLQTTKDEVIGKTKYSLLSTLDNVSITAIPSDHNFTQHNRQLLINYLQGVLNI